MIVPSERTHDVVRLLAGDDAVTHVTVVAGASRQPVGDLIECEVAREAASPLIKTLRDLGLERDGAIVASTPDLVMSAAARAAEEAAPGLPSDAVVWEQVESRTSEETSLSATYLVYLSVALMLAAVGVLLDSPILIVGAMVVGPEFGPIAALCVAAVQRRWGVLRRSLVALVVGFPVAMAATFVFTWLMTGLGLFDASMLAADRPLTSFIWRPDAISFVVAFLAGVAGMLSLTTTKSGALVGVLISVTTVPAAANASVALVYGVPQEFVGSVGQLILNMVGIVVAGILTLLVQSWWWSRREMRSTRSREATAIAEGARRAPRR
jgi:uncharacterized hydrophobic protein (TIGR00271 family)